MELQHILDATAFVLVIIYFAYQDSKNNKKILKIKKAELSLQIHRQAWFMSMSEYLNKKALTQELNDIQDLFLKAIAEERYEDAKSIQAQINKYLNKLEKNK